MKRLSYCYIVLLLICVACSKDDEHVMPEPETPAQPERPSDDEKKWLMDYGEVVIGIDILDEAGESLVDPDNPHNILDTDIHIIYKDIRYDMINSYEHKNSRLGGSWPEWYGVKAMMMSVSYSPGTGHVYAPRIAVGEWSGEKKGEETFVFVWDNENRSDTISFIISPYEDDYYGPMLGYHYYLNGDEIPSRRITLYR